MLTQINPLNRGTLFNQRNRITTDEIAEGVFKISVITEKSYQQERAHVNIEKISKHRETVLMLRKLR